MNTIGMIEKIGFKLAGLILIGLCSALLVFHISNFFGLVPLNITWLGRIESNSTMQIMTMISLILNAIIILCATVKCQFIKSPTLLPMVNRMLPFVFWWLIGNTIANLFSKSNFEVLVFTPILLVLTICVYRINIKPMVSA